jgi:hypothetical protein
MLPEVCVALHLNDKMIKRVDISDGANISLCLEATVLILYSNIK